MTRDFKKLEIWKDAHALALLIYETTSVFPPIERFGITNQIRRSAISVAANIAEGCGRSSEADFVRFLHHANGSLKETENFILLAKDLDYLKQDKYEKLAGEISLLGRKLYSFIESVKNKEASGLQPLPSSRGFI